MTSPVGLTTTTPAAATAAPAAARLATSILVLPSSKNQALGSYAHEAMTHAFHDASNAAGIPIQDRAKFYCLLDKPIDRFTRDVAPSLGGKREALLGAVRVVETARNATPALPLCRVDGAATTVLPHLLYNILTGMITRLQEQADALPERVQPGDLRI